MTTQTLAPALAPLIEYLESLTARADMDRLGAVMRSIRLSRADIAEYAKFSPVKYQRNLVCEGEHYQLLVLCWGSAQRSPIHDHAHSVCGVKVVEGTATETVFEPTPCGLIKPVSTSDLHEGQVIVSHDSDTHQISNLRAAGEDLITIHVYSPPLNSMACFSLDVPQVTEYRPMNVGHVDGCGI